jgi:hypothetical protein
MLNSWWIQPVPWVSIGSWSGNHRGMSYFIQGTTRSRPDTNLGSCRDFFRFVLWNLSVHITILSVRTVKSIGSYHISIGSYCEIYRFVSHFYRAVLRNLSVLITILSVRIVFLSYSVAIGNLHFDCPQNPTMCKDADHHLGKARTGSYHRPTNYRVVSWNRPWTDVVGPYRIAAEHSVNTSCIVHDEFYRFGSYRGWLGFELARVVLWIIGSYRKCTGWYSEFFRLVSWISLARTNKIVTRTGHDTNQSSGRPRFIIRSYRHKPILTYRTGCISLVYMYVPTDLLKSSKF